MPLIDKIGFIVHEPTLWSHYSSVWKHLDRSRFEIVLTSGFRQSSNTKVPGIAGFMEQVQRHGYPVAWSDERIRKGEKYAYTVSNHHLGGNSMQAAPAFKRVLAATSRGAKRAANAMARFAGRAAPYRIHGFAPDQYWPTQLGHKQIRFMYGADVGDGWSLDGWNELYAGFLCHGPNDQEQISKRFAGRTWQMGYPRYDAYFDPALDTSAERAEFDIDPRLKTVLWMPTFGDGACSIPFFARQLAQYNTRYNLIVRPHPFTFRKKPGDIALLRSLGYRLDDNPVRDMNKLYRLTDFLLCDYGGSAFGAVYLRKPMVLLDVPGSRDWYTVRNSSNLALAEHYPSVAPDDAARLGPLLDDEPYWAAQLLASAPLADRYFADYRGTSSTRAAEILMNLDRLLA
jgi:CDP-glycerol glycerophosphotransferase (TagB/SpsB family)